MPDFDRNSTNRSLVLQIKVQQEIIESLKDFIRGMAMESCLRCPDKHLCDKCGLQLQLELLRIR